MQSVNGVLGATDDYTRVTGAVRKYVTLRRNLVFAGRLLLQTSSGDVPMYDLPTMASSYKNEDALGGAKSLRGILKNRYIGKSMELENAELRWRFKEFSVMGKPMYLLASGFVDAGRVWTDGIKPSELLTDLHVGYGGGMRVGVGPSFLVAIDLGKSSESTQLYIGLGYLF